jgi:hypothetical protein
MYINVTKDNKKEALFLFALLNAPVNIKILENKQKTENEKEFLVSIKTIKQYIRIPKITNENAHVKSEIIKQTEAMLALEKYVLNDFVDFPPAAMQTFDFIRVEGNILVLAAGDKHYTAKINRNKMDFVKSIIEAAYFPTKGLVPRKAINIGELRFLPAIDFEAQDRIKAYVDDLVFALYFDVPITILGLENDAAVRAAVSKSDSHLLL